MAFYAVGLSSHRNKFCPHTTLETQIGSLVLLNDWLIHLISSDQELGIFKFCFLLLWGKKKSGLLTLKPFAFYRCKNDFSPVLFNLGRKFWKCRRDGTYGNSKHLFSCSKLQIFSISFVSSIQIYKGQIKNWARGWNSHQRHSLLSYLTSS